MSGENLRKKGSNMEDIAARYLTERGVKILEKNFRSKEAEIDLIGEEGNTLLFIEVKARKASGKNGTASEAVGTAKQKRICRCADYYMYRKDMAPDSRCIRFDVVAITIRTKENRMEINRENKGEKEESYEIRWIRNAFDYVRFKRSSPHWRVF